MKYMHCMFLPLCVLVSPMYDYLMQSISYYGEKRLALEDEQEKSREYWFYTGQQTAYNSLLNQLKANSYPFDQYEMKKPSE
jgi:hypothetical protein